MKIVRTVRVVLALGAAVLLNACTPGEPGLGDLQGDRAAAIRMPESVELAHFSGDKHLSLEGPQPAFDSRIFGTQATDEEVRAFYDRQLAQLGWRGDRLAGVMSTVELAAWGWCKTGSVFRIGIEDQPRAFRPEFYRGQTFRTVFEAAMEGRDPKQGCPERPVP